MATGMQELHRYQSSDVRQRQRGKDYASTRSSTPSNASTGLLGTALRSRLSTSPPRRWPSWCTMTGRAKLGIFHQRETTSTSVEQHRDDVHDGTRVAQEVRP